MEDKITIGFIMSWFKSAVEDKKFIPLEAWLDGAAKLIILSEDLDDLISAKEFELSKFKAALVGEGKSVASAELMAEAQQAHFDLMQAKALKERIKETVMIAKKRTAALTEIR